MSYELLVGLSVADPEQYQQYREEMLPLLIQYDGGFRYDFWIGETLKSETNNLINRVFLIYFKDKRSKSAFFNNPEYLQIKKKYYENSIEATTLLSEYETNSA